jgi:uncharacterized protein (TIRG00374 family)
MPLSLRIAAALAIAWWVIAHAGGAEIRDAVARIHPLWLIPTFALSVSESLLKALNWRAILSSILQRHLAWKSMWSAYLIGSFLGTAVPSSVGTDAVRSIQSRMLFGGPMASHVASVVLINVFNLVVGSATALAVFVWLGSQAAIPLTLQVLPLLFAGVTLAFPTLYLLLMWRRDALILGLRRLRRKRWFKVRHTLRRFIDSMLILNKAGSGPTRFLLISAAAVLAQSACWMSLGLQLGVDVPIAVWLLMVPANAILNILPLSVFGFGFHQAGHVAILAAYGAPASSALVISAVFTLISLAIGIGMGGYKFLVAGNIKRDVE